MHVKPIHTLLVAVPAAVMSLTLVPSARAQDPYAPVTTSKRADARPLLTPIGVGVAIGGGATNFTNSEISDITDIGGSWTARLTLGTRLPIALEGAYLGTANNITAPGLDGSAVLLGSGVEGLLRVNVLPMLPIQPYLFGGVAWRRYTIVNEDFNNSDVRDRDDVLEVPFGAGVAVRVKSILFDGRFDYRPTFNEDLLPDVDRSALDAGLENWNATARVGFEF